jgi:hypothetical protein
MDLLIGFISTLLKRLRNPIINEVERNCIAAKNIKEGNLKVLSTHLLTKITKKDDTAYNEAADILSILVGAAWLESIGMPVVAAILFSESDPIVINIKTKG